MVLEDVGRKGGVMVSRLESPLRRGGGAVEGGR